MTYKYVSLCHKSRDFSSSFALLPIADHPPKLEVIFCVQAVASPLLANLYLHWFDALFHGPQGPARKADVKLVRYADDFVAMAKQMGSETIEFMESRLEGKFQLEINREKTRVVDLREEGASLNFLGYTFRYDRDQIGNGRVHGVTAGREVPTGDQPGKDAGGGLAGRRSEPELSGIHVSV